MNNLLSTKLRGFVDCTDQSLLAKIFRTLACVASIPYSIVIRMRNRLYDYGVFQETRVPRKTIVVGNLTLGGVGKTPFVAWLTNRCLELGRKPGLISRGYKAKQQKLSNVSTSHASRNQDVKEIKSEVEIKYNSMNDEALEQALRFPTIPHFLGVNRVEVANAMLTQRPDVDVLLLDDAFQHRRIARDLDVLLLDALNPFGGKRVVPSGYLREPLSGMSRADAVLLSRADLIPPSEREKIRSKVIKIAPKAVWAEIAQKPRHIFQYRNHLGESNGTKSELPIQKLDYREWKESIESSDKFIAFCGLGAPQGFQKTLKNEKLNISRFFAFPDHCVYSSAHYNQLLVEAERVDAQAFITTMKDFVKLKEFAKLSNIPVYAIEIGVEFISGQEEFEKLLRQIIFQ